MPAWLCHPAAAVVATTMRGHPHPAQALPAPLSAPVHVLCALGQSGKNWGSPRPCFLEQPRASISHTHSAWQDPALSAINVWWQLWHHWLRFSCHTEWEVGSF